MMCTFKELEGKTFKKVEKIGDEAIRFYLTDNVYYEMHHIQDCCESVYIEDICGDLEDLTDERIYAALESTNSENNPDGIVKECQESFTYTFYTISSFKGSVDIRWYGESNGYYSESVDLSLVIND